MNFWKKLLMLLSITLVSGCTVNQKEQSCTNNIQDGYYLGVAVEKYTSEGHTIIKDIQYNDSDELHLILTFPEIYAWEIKQPDSSLIYCYYLSWDKWCDVRYDQKIYFNSEYMTLNCPFFESTVI